MKKLTLTALVFGAAVFASVPGNRLAIVQGTNVRCLLTNDGGTQSWGRTALDLDIQCPNIDGGGGQKVWVRAGCPLKADAGGSCVMDAGAGDLILDFTSATGNPDPVHFKLGSAEDRLCIGAVDGYTIGVYCPIYERKP